MRYSKVLVSSGCGSLEAPTGSVLVGQSYNDGYTGLIVDTSQEDITSVRVTTGTGETYEVAPLSQVIAWLSGGPVVAVVAIDPKAAGEIVYYWTVPQYGIMEFRDLLRRFGRLQRGGEFEVGKPCRNPGVQSVHPTSVQVPFDSHFDVVELDSLVRRRGYIALRDAGRKSRCDQLTWCWSSVKSTSSARQIHG